MQRIWPKTPSQRALHDDPQRLSQPVGRPSTADVYVHDRHPAGHAVASGRAADIKRLDQIGRIAKVASIDVRCDESIGPDLNHQNAAQLATTGELFDQVCRFGA